MLRALDPALAAVGVAAAAAGRPRAARDCFATLAARLADEQPVAARGVLLAQALLRDAGEPALLRRGGARCSRPRSAASLGALEP